MKKLTVFIFSILLFGSCEKEGCTDVYSIDYNAKATKDDGSCSDDRRVKFIVEIGSFTYFYTTPAGQTNGLYGEVDCELDFGYTSNNPILFNEQVIIQFDQISNNEVLYAESDEFILTKNENVKINFDLYLTQITDASITAKAIVGNEEIVFYNENINNAPWNRDSTFNWIVP